MRRAALATLALVAAGAGCGGDGGPAGPALRQTAANLDRIESAVLSLSVRLEPEDGGELGYEIEGPIRLGKEGAPPVADVEYTQYADDSEETVRLVLAEDGSGHVERDGERVELSEAQLAELREAGTLLGRDGLASLGFEQWIDDPELSGGPGDTDKVTAELDVAAAMTGLSALAGLLRQDVVLTAEQRREVADVVEESSFELLTGKDDRLLRRLALAFTLEAEVPGDLREALGDDAVGASFSFELELDDVNGS